MNDQPLRPAPKTGKGIVDLAFIGGEQDFGLHAESQGRSLRARDDRPRRVWILDIDEDRNTHGGGLQLAEEPDPFGPEVEVHRANASYIAARSIEGFKRPARTGSVPTA